MKVLLSAYACEPNKGGECGLGWHWALESARLGHDVWVLTRSNNRDTIEHVPTFLPNLHFIYHDLPSWLVRLKKKGPFLQFYYAFWQWSAYRKARELHEQQRFDMVQHVTFAVFRHASFMGRLGIPFIFGPVAGGERVPVRLRMDYGIKGHVADALRDAANVVAKLNPWLHQTFAAASSIIVTTPDTRVVVPSRYQQKVRHQIVIGAPAAPHRAPRAAPARGVRLLFVGRFLFLKGMQYGLRGFARLLREAPDARLTIVGGGPEGPRWRRLCHTLNIAHAVDWIGWTNQADLSAIYDSHDVFLFPSLHDSSGLVILEAMAHGLPVICFDLGGPGVLVTETSGIVIRTRGQKREQLIAGLAGAMKSLSSQPDTLRGLQTGALARARQLTWASAVGQVYDAPCLRPAE